MDDEEFRSIFPNIDMNTGFGKNMRENSTKFERDWSRKYPVRALAMIVAGDKLLVLGVRDLAEGDESTLDRDPEKWAEQEAILQGEHGGELLVLDKKSGEKLSRVQLDFLPVREGMIAAGGKLYVSAEDGTVRCLKGVR